MTRSEVQVPHRPPKKNTPLQGYFSLGDHAIRTSDLAREEVRGASGAPQGRHPEQAALAAAVRRGRGTWPSPSPPTNKIVKQLSGIESIIQKDAVFSSRVDMIRYAYVWKEKTIR